VLGRYFHIDADLAEDKTIAVGLPLPDDAPPVISDLLTIAHYADGKWVKEPVDSIRDGNVYFTACGFSTFAIASGGGAMGNAADILAEVDAFTSGAAYMNGGAVYANDNGFAQIEFDLKISGVSNTQNNTVTVSWAENEIPPAVLQFQPLGNGAIALKKAISIVAPEGIASIVFNFPGEQRKIFNVNLTAAQKQLEPGETVRLQADKSIADLFYFQNVIGDRIAISSPLPLLFDYVTVEGVQGVEGRINKAYDPLGGELPEYLTYTQYFKDHLGSTRMVVEDYRSGVRERRASRGVDPH